MHLENRAAEYKNWSGKEKEKMPQRCLSVESVGISASESSAVVQAALSLDALLAVTLPGTFLRTLSKYRVQIKSMKTCWEQLRI